MIHSCSGKSAQAISERGGVLGAMDTMHQARSGKKAWQISHALYDVGGEYSRNM